MTLRSFLPLLLLPSLLSAAPRISEFMADNASVLADADGAFTDWIEIHNPDAVAVNLQDYALTDDPAVPAKWRFPAVTLNAGARLTVFASGKNRAVAGSELHTNFLLSAEGEYLALVAPDGVTAVQSFNPYPPQEENQSYGLPETLDAVSYLNAPGQVLVPASAGALPADWHLPSYTPGAAWSGIAAPPGAGFDTGVAAPVPANISTTGNAVQSTTFSTYTAAVARNGVLTDYTHTLSTDTAPFWVLTFPNPSRVDKVVVRNRGDGCCGSRLRDITIELLDNTGAVTHTSPLLNPENAGYTYPAGPALVEYDLVAALGTWVSGVKSVRVRRTADADLSATAGQGTDDEKNALSMSEVEVTGISGGGLVNLARSGSPAPTATQSTTLSSYSAAVAIDGNTGNFTHTLSTDTNPTWTLNLQRKALISSIVINNRGGGCCQWRLRDITVTILDSNNSTVLYTSPLLNPENSLLNPATLTVDLSAAPVYGQFVRIRRTPDPDNSGAGTGTSADDASVLSMGEVTVNGVDVNGVRSLIRTDLQSTMAGVNASAFLRIPFTVADPSLVRGLSLRMRYDDGFAVWLNGAKVAERNAPASLAWDSAATANRVLSQVFTPETIDLGTFISSLTAGTNLLAVQGLNSSAADAEFLIQPELTGSVLSASPGNVFLEDPTPGALNNTAWFYDTVKDTAFSHKRGFYDSQIDLTISSPTPGAQIYYTTNNSEPSPTNGTLVTGPIAISATTVIRARAYLQDYRPTNIDTHTYIFLADVTNKPKVIMGTGGTLSTGTVANIPAGWPTNAATNGGQAFNWGFDTGVRNLYTPEQMRESLTQIPVISVVTQQNHLTDPTTGIYVNGIQHGDAWERPGSIEMLDISKPGALPEDGHGEFALGCGLRIRGGASRGDGSTKHSFRVFFRKAYGDGKLAYRLYGADGAAEFENFDLRGSQNYSWSQNATDVNETMVRDPYARITLGAMGQPHTRSRYCHLFLNGLYWGIYDIHERADNSFGESYIGGDKTNYDGIKCGDRYTAGKEFMTEATDGYLTTNPDGSIAAWKDLWDRSVAMRTAGAAGADAAYFRVQGRNPDGSRNPAWPVLLDVDNLIDYMLIIYWTGDGDAPLSNFLSSNRPNNWFSLRDRLGTRGFTFYCQDGEHTLLAPSWSSDRTGPWLTQSNSAIFNYSNPQWVQDSMAVSPEYRLRFADRVRKHFFNGGALVSSVAKQRWVDKAAQINTAIRAYAARYSTTSAGVTAWNTRINFIRDNFFDSRNATVLSQLTTDQLWPSLAAPDFSQHGGNVPAGYQLTMTGPAGATVYFTTDGSDPRVAGGTIAATATTYTGAIPLTTPGIVSARSRNGTTWSPLTTAFFGVALEAAASSNLNVTELHYNPADPSTPAELAAATDSDLFEFIEIANVSATSSVDLNGVRFTGGITTVALGHEILAPGERGVFVANLAAFNARYSGLVPAPRVLGVFSSGNLSNGGEQIVLSGSAGDIRDFIYDDAAPWPVSADGQGMSLTLIRPGPAANHSLASSWRGSAAAAGTPGGTDSTGYAAWKTQYSQATDAGDSDGDGLSALLEYALGTNPGTPSQANVTAQADPGGALRVTFRHSATADDIIFLPETSTALTGWTSAGLVFAGQVNHGDGTVTSSWVTPVPTPAEPRRFVRGAVMPRP